MLPEPPASRHDLAQELARLLARDRARQDSAESKAAATDIRPRRDETFDTDAGCPEGGSIKRCAIHARFSTDKQNVLSIETQLMKYRMKITRKGWQEVACFTEPSKLAATLHRPGMKALSTAVLIFEDHTTGQ